MSDDVHVITIEFTDADEARRAYDAIEALLHGLGEIGTLSAQRVLRHPITGHTVTLDKANGRVVSVERDDLLKVVRMAAQAWDALETMYRERDQGIRHSGPRDKFESFIDALTTDAKDALSNTEAQNDE